MVRRFAALAALFACGCSGDPSPEEKFVDAYAALVCPSVKTCCAESLPANFDCNRVFSSRPLTGYDDAKGQACLAAVEAEADPCARIAVPACSSVLGGEEESEAFPAEDGKAEGEACESMFDCASPAGGDADCRPAVEGGEDVCIVEYRGAEGDACSSSCTRPAGGGRSCSGPLPGPPGTRHALCDSADNLRCDFDTLKCVPLSSAGQECLGNSDCAQGLVCAFASSAMQSDRPTCQAPRAPGETCATPYGSADRSVCGDGYCDETDLTCKAPVAAGGACDPSVFVNVCGANGYCDADSSTCAAYGGGLGGLGGGLLCLSLALASGGAF